MPEGRNGNAKTYKYNLIKDKGALAVMDHVPQQSFANDSLNNPYWVKEAHEFALVIIPCSHDSLHTSGYSNQQALYR